MSNLSFFVCGNFDHSVYIYHHIYNLFVQIANRLIMKSLWLRPTLKLIDKSNTEREPPF